MITETVQTPDAVEPQSLREAVRKFWGTLPCGVSHSAQPTDSHAFFEETEKHRFKIHTDLDRPFLKDAVRFHEHTGKSVLEVGVGIGVDAMEWHKAGNHVTGIDYNMPSVETPTYRAVMGRVTNAKNEPVPDAIVEVLTDGDAVSVRGARRRDQAGVQLGPGGGALRKWGFRGGPPRRGRAGSDGRRRRPVPVPPPAR